jgi:hypothetical protein
LDSRSDRAISFAAGTAAARPATTSRIAGGRTVLRPAGTPPTGSVSARRFGYLAAHADALPFASLLRHWTDDVMVFTNGALEVPAAIAARFDAQRIRVEERPITG